MPVTVELDATKLIAAMKVVTDNLTKDMNTAAWKTARKGESLVAKDVVAELNVAQKTVKSAVKSSRKSAGYGGASVYLNVSNKIPLHLFKGTRVKKGTKKSPGGVTYKISKSKGKRFRRIAFPIEKWGNKIYIRGGLSAPRYPIYAMKGPSPWGWFVKNKRSPVLAKQLKEELKKQIEQRIIFLKKKTAGTLSWQTK